MNNVIIDYIIGIKAFTCNKLSITTTTWPLLFTLRFAVFAYMF